MPELPRDLVEEEILCRVPATSLKRLRSTCKRSNLLFMNRRFATKHYDKAAKENLVLMETHPSSICALNVNLHGSVPSLEVKSRLILIDPRSNNSDPLDIHQVFHCDSLLLCTINDLSMRVVWNPCTGQTRWIKTGRDKFATRYVLGYYQDSKSSSRSFKVLSFPSLNNCWEIYEFSSDSWRLLDHDITPNWYTSCGDSHHMVSLKGKLYWLATDHRETNPGVDLLSFDFSSEKVSVLVRLPYHQCCIFEIASLSVVGQEKLSVLLQRDRTSKTEIWVTNTIDETKPVSWSKVLALDLSPDLGISSFGTFLLDEEKKLALCCERLIYTDGTKDMDKIYCLGEDNKVTQVYLRVDTTEETEEPVILSYVPSLVQIEPVGGTKRRRGD